MPRESTEDDPPTLSNAELAAIFREIGDLVELRGDLVYKAVAYRRAADAIARAPVEVARAYRDGAPPRLPGVGAAIAKKLEELVATGRLAFHERLREEVPPSLLEILAIPGVGPRTARELHESLGIATVAALEAAARTGALRGLRGMTARTEERILEGIELLRRRSPRILLGRAEAHVASLVSALAPVDGVRSVTAAGSFRRRCETVGDLDLLVETSDPAAAVAAIASLAEVTTVIARGREKASVELHDGVQVDLMTFAPGEGGTYLVHFTGSKEHNVRIRGLARDMGWSLSEKGFVRLGPDGQPLAGADSDLRTFASEAETYAFLGLPFIPPELREDRGEVEAALQGRLPILVDAGDLQGDCHAHSDWSDGVHDLDRMAVAARALGYAYLVISDHSFGLGIARGLTADRVAEQRTLIEALNDRLASEEAAGTAPPGTHRDGFRVLHGCEVEIRSDGSLDFDDAVLERFDLVVAALHQGRRQSRDQLTARVLAAIRHPHVHVIAHPAGRMLLERPELDLEWEAVIPEAARTGTALEIDASDHRLDLDDLRARRARDAGCLIAIDSDAHRTEELQSIRWGVGIARRAWLRREDVVNAMARAELVEWARGKASRI